ncbi:MAG: choice-of-anchor Q domain-containing protein, partial [Acidimicrobiales bacterium]
MSGLVLGVQSSHAASRVLYVAASGGAKHGACSAADPCTLDGAMSQAALTSGSVVEVPAGTFYGTLVIPSSITIQGTGPNTMLTGSGGPAVIVDQGSDVTLADLTINGSRVARLRYGAAGIDNAGTLTLSDVNVTGNSLSVGIDSAGGIFNGPTGIVTMSGGSVSGNSDSNSATCAGGIANEGIMTLTAVTVSNNRCQAPFVNAAGGITSGGQGFANGVQNSSTAQLTIDASTVTLNSTGNSCTGTCYEAAGGILSDSTQSGVNTVMGTTFSGNTAGSSGGAIFAVGSLAVSSSTFNGNVSEDTGGAVSAGLPQRASSVSISTSTFANNTAEGRGGAIDIGNGYYPGAASAQLSIASSTLLDNTSMAGGGGVASQVEGYDKPAPAVSLAADIFDESTCYITPGSGSFSDAGYNLSSDNTCGFTASTSKVVSSSQLGSLSLANNGGPTQTIAITSSSPAYDVIPSSSVLCSGGTITLNSSPITIPYTDQRGVLRLQSGATGCDIGAYQVGSLTLAPQTLPPAHLNQPYSVPFTTTNAYQPLYSITSGALPTGLTLDAATGEITGTPTKTGVFSFTLSLQSGTVQGALTQSYTISVTNPPPPHITSINPTHVPQYTSSFITISGRDLTKAGTTCYGALEMARCGVSVTIGGDPATVAYASP